LRWLFGTETPKKPVSLREALDFPCQQTTLNEPKDDLKKKKKKPFTNVLKEQNSA
jgi:hypothetical protein